MGLCLILQTCSTQASPLHIASRNNYLNIASLLLKAGAKTHLKDSDGKVKVEENTFCSVMQIRVLYFKVYYKLTAQSLLCNIMFCS